MTREAWALERIEEESRAVVGCVHIAKSPACGDEWRDHIVNRVYVHARLAAHFALILKETA
jgi:hypothetical protein